MREYHCELLGWLVLLTHNGNGTESDKQKLDRLLHAKPIDVERDHYRQELLKLASQRISNVQQYVVSTHAT